MAAHDSPVAAIAEEIDRAAQQGASLARRLQDAGERRDDGPPEVDATAVVLGAVRSLSRLLGAETTLSLELDPRPMQVRVSAAHLEQIVLQLAVRAREAAPGPGAMRVETRRAFSDAPWLEIVVAARASDGVARDAAAAEGSSGALMAARATVRQAGGTLEVDVAPDGSTRLVARLPSGTPPVTAGAANLTRSLVVVDDDDMVRRSLARLLQRVGYPVVAFAGGRDALDALERTAGKALLLLTDVSMPGMTGIDLARAATALNPSLPVVLMSGYVAPDVGVSSLELPGGKHPRFLQKPVRLEELREALNDLLPPPTPGRPRPEP